MRVVYLHQYFNTPDMIGGTRSYEMARRLVEWGHEVHMVTTWRERDGRKGWFQTVEGGIHVHWQPVPYSNNMGFITRILAFLRFALGASRRAVKLEADVVLATSTPLTIAIPGIYAARKQKIPMVFEIRDVWPDVPIALGMLKNPILKWLARHLELFAYRSASRIIALAPGMKEAIVNRGIDPKLIDVIPNGADLALFHGQEVDATALLDRYRIPQNRKVILYAGTLGMVNGVDYIVRLASELQQHEGGDRYLFVVIGEGREAERLKQLAQELSVLNQSLYFLGGKTKREVSEWFHCCTASIMTYSGPEVVYRDSVSNKFFDSLAAAKPVLANFSGFSTLIAEKHGAGKILPTNPAFAPEPFMACLGDDHWVVSAGQKARQLGEREFSRHELARELEQTLLRACSADNAF